MKHFLLLTFFSLLTTAGLKAQVDVTFQVNMNDISDLYDGGSVWIYMDADWSEYYTMTDGDMDGIYSYTLSKAEGTNITYSFSYQTGPDEWNDYVVEAVPVDCADENGWRSLTVPASSVTLSAVYYGSCSDEISAMFRVNMADISDLTGDVSFVWWDEVAEADVWETMSLTENDIYTFTKAGLTLSNTLYYYFAYNESGTWEVVPAECDAGDGYRGFAPTMAYEELPAYMFSSCNEQPPLPDVTVTFKVDMSNETVSGDGMQVVIKDPWIWTAMADEGNGIWSASVALAPNQTYPYTFVNGAQDYWDGEESITGDCNKGSAGAPERHVSVLEDNVLLSTVIFGTCNKATALNKTAKDNFNIYPVPADKVLNIENSETIHSLALYSLSGHLIKQQNVNSKTVAIETTTISNGMYLIKLKTDNTYVQRKVIVQH